MTLQIDTSENAFAGIHRAEPRRSQAQGADGGTTAAEMRPAAVLTLSQQALEWAGAVPLVPGASDVAASVPTTHVDSPETTDAPLHARAANDFPTFEHSTAGGSAFGTMTPSLVDAGGGSTADPAVQNSASALVARYQDLLSGLDRGFAAV